MGSRRRRSCRPSRATSGSMPDGRRPPGANDCRRNGWTEGYICSRTEWTPNSPMSQIAIATPKVSAIWRAGFGNDASSGRPGGTTSQGNLLFARVHSRCLKRGQRALIGLLSEYLVIRELLEKRREPTSAACRRRSTWKAARSPALRLSPIPAANRRSLPSSPGPMGRRLTAAPAGWTGLHFYWRSAPSVWPRVTASSRRSFADQGCFPGPA